MKQIMALLLASGLMVPLFPTPAFCAKSSAAATHKKAPKHKHPAGHAKASSASTASGQKPTSGSSSQE